MTKSTDSKHNVKDLKELSQATILGVEINVKLSGLCRNCAYFNVAIDALMQAVKDEDTGKLKMEPDELDDLLDQFKQSVVSIAWQHKAMEERHETNATVQ